uniref:lymphotoxin-beta isoform X1 n=1 Tax=Jaculus jaculus TaxID=51337 RepID=UPI000332F56F|nr:lymphotoxin-beta isoform X1 [Jaculus jaculus]
MGTPGLQDLGGRPQGRGCLLLVVAGVTSLVTLLLTVPITVLAVLALVPQEQGGRVTETTGHGAQAQLGLEERRPSCLLPSPTSLSGTPDSHPGPRTAPSSNSPDSPAPSPAAQSSQPSYVGVATLPPTIDSSPVPRFQQLPEEEEEPETHVSPTLPLPAAHLIGARMQGLGLGWEAQEEEAFLRSGARFSEAAGLALPRDGLYYLYCHVGYRGRAPPAGRGRSVTLRSSLYRAGGAYGPGSAQLLLEGAETVTPLLDRAGHGRLWYTSVGFGGLVQLRRGERLHVNVSHPDLVDCRRGKTFFGAVMVG